MIRRRVHVLIIIFILLTCINLLSVNTPVLAESGSKPAIYFLEGDFIQIIEYSYSVNATRENDGTVTIYMRNLPEINEYGYYQQIMSEQITTSHPESVRKQHKGPDYSYVELFWINAPSTVVARRTARVENRVRYGPYHTIAPFPVNPTLFSIDISPFLKPEALIQVDDPAIRGLAQELAAGSLCQMDAVVRILNWVQMNIRYGCPAGGAFGADAVSTLRNRVGNCVNFANLAVALLRAVGIPSIPCGGFVADRPESAAGHAWIAVLYPENQWVEYESSYWMPTGDLVPETFLMPQHITFGPVLFEPGVARASSFHELHEATWNTVSIPQKVQSVRVEAVNNEFLCLPLVVESGGNQYLLLNWTSPSHGWKASSSCRTVWFNNTDAQTILFTLSTPQTGGFRETITVKLVTPKNDVLGEVVIEAQSTEGEPAPDFTLTDIDGNSFTLSACKGKVVLLDFFATWCGPCKNEVAYLKELKDLFQTNLIIASITGDPNYDTVDKLKQFRTEYGVTWPILRDTDAKHVSTTLYGVSTLPTLFIIDQDGIIHFKHIGLTGSSVLASEVQSLIATAKTQTRLTLSINPATVLVHGEATISGSIDPPLTGKQILIRITCPNNTVLSKTVLTTSGGSFSTSLRLDKEGVWSLKAFFTGDLTHSSSESIDTVLTVVQPASFEASSLNISPSSVKVGQSSTISVTVKNIGGESGTYEVTLKVNNQVVDIKTGVLGSGQSTTVSFTYTPTSEGIYSIDVNGLAGSLTVNKEEPPWLIIIAVMALIIIVLLVMLLRRKPKAEVPPPPPPPPETVQPEARLYAPMLERHRRFKIKRLLLLAISSIFIMSILIGAPKQYGTVQAFVNFLCLSCIGIG
jgi:peroxiredoxin